MRALLRTRWHQIHPAAGRLKPESQTQASRAPPSLELRSRPDGPAPRAGQRALQTAAAPRQPPPACRGARRRRPPLDPAAAAAAGVDNSHSPDAAAQPPTHQLRALPGQRREGLPPPGHAPPPPAAGQCGAGTGAGPRAGRRGQARGGGGGGTEPSGLRGSHLALFLPAVRHPPRTGLKGTGASLPARDSTPRPRHAVSQQPASPGPATTALRPHLLGAAV